MKKKLLWIGDAGCPSGFARVTHAVLDVLSKVYDVTVLGINYRGDPYDPRIIDSVNYPYPIYAAAAGGDMFGVKRLIWMCDIVKPDVIVCLNDPWNIPAYTRQLHQIPEYANIPVIASLAVDGKNVTSGKLLNDLKAAIFWTDFGLCEARAGGYQGEAHVIPLGVDTKIFRPMQKKEWARKDLVEPYKSAFIVGNVNRNQPRKRWDLTIKYFCQWVKDFKIEDAVLYLHTAPTGDTGCDVLQLMKYYGLLSRLICNETEVWYGASNEDVARTYNIFDVAISTTQGEGMGLTALEAMACGVPCILPDWSAFGDWAVDGAMLVPCTSTTVGAPYVNVIGGVPDEGKFLEALNAMYNIETRLKYAQKAFKLAHEDRFQWSQIGQEYLKVINSVVSYEDAEPIEEEESVIG